MWKKNKVVISYFITRIVHETSDTAKIYLDDDKVIENSGDDLEQFVPSAVYAAPEIAPIVPPFNNSTHRAVVIKIYIINVINIFKILGFAPFLALNFLNLDDLR